MKLKTVVLLALVLCASATAGAPVRHKFSLWDGDEGRKLALYIGWANGMSQLGFIELPIRQYVESPIKPEDFAAQMEKLGQKITPELLAEVQESNKRLIERQKEHAKEIEERRDIERKAIESDHLILRIRSLRFCECLEQLEYEQIIAMIDKYHDAHPEKWNRDFSEQLTEALTVSGGPCEGRNPWSKGGK